MEEASIIVVEATAMRGGVKEAIDMGFKHIIVEGDNKMVIQLIQGEVKVAWQIQLIIQDIKIFIEKQVRI